MVLSFGRISFTPFLILRVGDAGKPCSLLGCASPFAHCPERQTTRQRQLSEEGCYCSDLQLGDRGDMASFLAAEVATVLGSMDVMWLIYSPVCRSGNRGNLGWLL